MVRAVRSSTIVMVLLMLSPLVSAEEIPGWGTVVNPDGDCDIDPGDGSVTIWLPERKHDLWYGGRDPSTRFNSPRILQTVEGNFIATVRVTARWKANIADGGYNGAGLLVWDSEDQYLRHERNRMGGPATGPEGVSYITPLYDQKGRRVFLNWTSDDFFEGNSTWLQIERRNQTFITQVSQDGENWTMTGYVSTEFPQKVQVGVHAVSGTGKRFGILYDKFSITKR